MRAKAPSVEMRNRSAPKTILITGGNDGIGLQIAHVHVRDGDTVIVVGKRRRAETALARAQYNRVIYIAQDLAAHNADGAIVKCLQLNAVTHIDCLYLNAAVGYYGDFLAQPLDAVTAMIAVNVGAPLKLLQRLMPYLTPQSGSVTVIGTIATRLYSKRYALYSATKAALAEGIRAIQIEQSPRSAVRIVHLGAVRTAIHAKSGMRAEEIARMRAMDSMRVAKKIVKSRKKSGCVGVKNTLLFWSMRGRSLLLLRPWRALSNAAPCAPNDAAGAIVIIGAADGIGYQIAQHFLSQRCHLILVDYHAQLLTQRFEHARATSAATINLIVCDIAQDAARKRLYQTIRASAKIDMLYISAAISAVGSFALLPHTHIDALLNTNCVAPLQLIYMLLSGERFKKNARIVLFSSLSYFIGYPGAAVYAATKSLLAVWALALHREIAKKYDVYLHVVFPGPTKTAHAARYSPDNSRAARRMSPRVSANSIIRAVAKKRCAIGIGMQSALMAKIGILFPHAMGRVLYRTIFKKIRAPLLPPE